MILASEFAICLPAVWIYGSSMVRNPNLDFSSFHTLLCETVEPLKSSQEHRFRYIVMVEGLNYSSVSIQIYHVIESLESVSRFLASFTLHRLSANTGCYSCCSKMGGTASLRKICRIANSNNAK